MSLTSCIDTLVLSYLYNPGLENGHGLEAWGKRLKYPKGDFNDFSRLTPEMVTYCRNDVELTFKVYNALTEKMRRLGFSELSADIEHKIRVILDEQQRNGIWFARERASSFRDFLRLRQTDLAKQIRTLFPDDARQVAEYPFRRTKDGSPFKSYGTHVQKYDRVEHFKRDGKEFYRCFQTQEFNLNSPKQRVDRLLALGWKPEKFTEKGFPKVDEDALMVFAEESGKPEIAALAEYLVIQGRASMLDTWFNNLGEDSRIHGRVLTCGATTRRMIHFLPNTANIPSGAKAKYGKEVRSFWGVEPDKGLVLVGYDASGLETAGLCHYLNNPEATHVLLRDKPNDIHTSNARRLSEALNRPVDREWGAKTTWYAWLYGAGVKKLGSILKGSPSDGEVVVETFFRNVPGLKELINDVQGEWNTSSGLIRCIDSGYVRCPSRSAALNYLIQSMGAILMKMTSIILDEDAKKLGLPFLKVLDVHDEGQLQVEEKYAKDLGELAVRSIEKAARELKLNVPVTGSYSIGPDWSFTH